MSAPMDGVVEKCGDCGELFPVSKNYMGMKPVCEDCRPPPGVLAQAQPLQGGWVSGPQADLARQAQLARQADLDRQQAEINRQQAELDRQRAQLGYW